MLQPLGFINGHYECRSLKETLPVLGEILALKVVQETQQEAIVKHPNTDWQLVVHEGGASAPDKPRFNHYGVRVASDREVDNAYEYLQSVKKQLRLKVDKVRDNHHAHSVHFVEPGGNWWEIESYEKAVEANMGKTTAPHWRTPLSEMNFPGKGYIPQALTHGTVQCNNLEETRRFYEEALGLEVVQLWPNSLYVKHQSSPWYVVNLQATPETRRYMRPEQRFTLAVESAAAVYNAREWLKQHQRDFAITELSDIQNQAGRASFLLSDLNQNWWEITSPSGT